VPEHPVKDAVAFEDKTGEHASNGNTVSMTAMQGQDIAQLVLDISQKVARADNLDHQLQVIVEEVTQVTGSERGSLFLKDPQTDELYSRIALGGVEREIRFLNNTGIAGWVFTHGKALIVKDAYEDPRFNQSIDQKSGFTTRNILCVPVRAVRGESLELPKP